MFKQMTASNSGMGSRSNTVLRNTYMLLAFSMIPTILGAWIGMNTGIMAAMGAGVSTIVFLVFAFGMMFAIEKNKNSSAGVGLLLVFTLGMGLFLSRLLIPVLGLVQGPAIVMTAFGGTATVLGVMAFLSSVVKRDLGNLYKFLIVGFCILFVCSLINIFFQSTAAMMVLSSIAILIFSGFLFFDLRRVVDGSETNYISATLSIYLSLYNILTSLIQLLTGISMGSSD